jgi:maspardin
MAISTQRTRFDRIYARVDNLTRQSLLSFRQDHPPKQLDVNGATWSYLSLGRGEEIVLFLHGLAGAYDIWWQQIEALKDRYRILSVTYPAVDSLEAMSQGILHILSQEDAGEVNVVGSSLGGYLAQYLLAGHPNRVRRAILANTFPPNERIFRGTKLIGKLLAHIPEWLITFVHKLDSIAILYPASGKSELVRAYLLEATHRSMSKQLFMARYHCVVEHFTPPVQQAQRIPILILEADNDPLISRTLRFSLKVTYPSAIVHTFHAAGHFPYLSHPNAYTELVEHFLDGASQHQV